MPKPQDGQSRDLLVAGVYQAEIRQQLERMFRSDAFRRSGRLQAFLTYICDLTVRGDGHQINEYLLATEVFHRPSGFAANADSTVRSQAHLLRQKLERYYRTDGQTDALLIEVPVGHYVPVFRRQPGLSFRQRFDLRRLVRKPNFRIDALIILVAASMFLIGRATVRNRGGASLRPTYAKLEGGLAEFWGPWLDDPAGALLCFSDPLTGVIKHYGEPRRGVLINNSVRVSPPEEATIRAVFDMPPAGYIYMTPNYSQVKKGESFAAVKLAHLFASTGSRLRVAESRSISWTDLRRNSIILFGNNDTDSWIDPLLEKYAFRLSSHRGSTPRSIEVTAPTELEQQAYRTEYPDDLSERRLDYALVSALPSLNGNKHMLLVNGLTHFATQAAVDYLTTPTDIEPMLAHLREVSNQEQTPSFFQLVLEVEVREGNITGSRPAALRIIEPKSDERLFFNSGRGSDVGRTAAKANLRHVPSSMEQ